MGDLRVLCGNLKGKGWLKQLLSYENHALKIYNYGFIVDAVDYYRWLELTDYKGGRFRVVPKFCTPLKAVEMLCDPCDPNDYQVVHPQITHGGFVTFVPFPDLNKKSEPPIPLDLSLDWEMSQQT